MPWTNILSSQLFLSHMASGRNCYHCIFSRTLRKLETAPAFPVWMQSSTTTKCLPPKLKASEGLGGVIHHTVFSRKKGGKRGGKVINKGTQRWKELLCDGDTGHPSKAASHAYWSCSSVTQTIGHSQGNIADSSDIWKCDQVGLFCITDPRKASCQSFQEYKVNSVKLIIWKYAVHILSTLK